MKIMGLDPKKILGTGITKMGRQELCEFASRLCRRVTAEVGTRGRRGGIYPANISYDADGNIGLGPATASPWNGEELKFVAPELYWNGQCGAAADVYSVGLLLYYAVSGGRLPYEGECQDPQLRRMGGEDLDPPKNAGRRLGNIIEKCIRFKAADRYQTLEELRVVLDSCVKNLYLSGVPSAEAIFRKNDDDLSPVERMMVGIIEKGEQEESPEELPEPEVEEIKVYSPAQPKETPKAERPDKSAGAVPTLTPITPNIPAAPAVKEPPVQYSRNLEREKKIAEQVKKRRRRPLAVILVLCALLVVVALIFNAMLEDFQQASKIPDNSIAGMTMDPYAATVEPQPSPDSYTALPEASEEPAVASPVPTGHSYVLVKEDVSWTQARDKCVAMGGHLAVINNEAEFNEIVALAEENGVNKVWVGCHRENDTMVWVNGDVGYLDWATGEPSYEDVNDKVSEDYVLLWDNNGWAMNDSRNDPVADYPQWYSGTIGFVCEFGD